MLGLSSEAILLCTLCTIAKALIFDWLQFEPIMGRHETLIDFSDTKIKHFEANGTQVNYMYGSSTFKEVFNKTHKVSFILRWRSPVTEQIGKVPGIPDRYVTSCDYADKIYPEYFLPMSEHHNDYPPRTRTFCPIQARAYNILPVDNLKQLDAPSRLRPNEYTIRIVYYKRGNQIGGFKGHFFVKTL